MKLVSKVDDAQTLPVNQEPLPLGPPAVYLRDMIYSTPFDNKEKGYNKAVQDCIRRMDAWWLEHQAIEAEKVKAKTLV